MRYRVIALFSSVLSVVAAFCTAAMAEEASRKLPAPLPVAVLPPQQMRATPVKRSVADARRPQRVAQQRPIAPSKPSTGLKSIPLIGPVFSFLGG